MPKFAIVVRDPDKHHAFEVRRYTEAFQRAGATRPKAEREAARRVPATRASGFVHAEAQSECPDGLPNCRNCGDPAFAKACASAGHCLDCGTKHGVAPESVLTAHGLGLEPR